MSITGIGGFGGLSFKNQTQQNLPEGFDVPDAAKVPAKKDRSASRQEFMDYMNKSPAERMQEAWLAQHGISKEKFEAMTPEEKQALLNQMKQEIEMKAKQKAEEMSKKSLNIMA